MKGRLYFSGGRRGFKICVDDKFHINLHTLLEYPNNIRELTFCDGSCRELVDLPAGVQEQMEKLLKDRVALH